MKRLAAVVLSFVAWQAAAAPAVSARQRLVSIHETFGTTRSTVESLALRVRACRFYDARGQSTVRRVVGLYEDVRAPVNARIDVIAQVMRNRKGPDAQTMAALADLNTVNERLRNFHTAATAAVSSGTCKPQVIWKEVVVTVIGIVPAAWQAIVAFVDADDLDEAERESWAAQILKNKIEAWQSLEVNTADTGERESSFSGLSERIKGYVNRKATGRDIKAIFRVDAVPDIDGMIEMGEAQNGYQTFWVPYDFVPKLKEIQAATKEAEKPASGADKAASSTDKGKRLATPG